MKFALKKENFFNLGGRDFTKLQLLAYIGNKPVVVREYPMVQKLVDKAVRDLRYLRSLPYGKEYTLSELQFSFTLRAELYRVLSTVNLKNYIPAVTVDVVKPSFSVRSVRKTQVIAPVQTPAKPLAKIASYAPADMPMNSLASKLPVGTIVTVKDGKITIKSEPSK